MIHTKPYSILTKYFLLSLPLLFWNCNNSGSNATAEAPEEKMEISTNNFNPIFNGSDLSGWEGDTDYWKVENGSIVGELTEDNPLEANTFLIWREEMPGDFELKVDFKITENGNSGINYRSEELSDPEFALKGYQADIDGKNTYTGQNYEERGRAFLAKRGEQSVLKPGQDPTITSYLGDNEELKAKINQGDWNSLHIIAEGNNLKHYVNGVLMSEVTDEDAEHRKSKGHLGFQVHKGPPMKVQYKNIEYKKF